MAKSILVLGLGETGAAVARHALSEGDEVTVYAGKSSEKARTAAEPLEASGARVVFDSEDVEGAFDLCVASPGIPKVSAFYASATAAAGELVSEPEYLWRESPENWVAVTGTNGKTTTTSLIAHLLRASGRTAWLCGNTEPMTVTAAIEGRAEGDWAVAELSSFQLASTRDFSPRAAVLLNIASDHIAWHGSQEEYAADKLKVLANLGQGSTAVLCDVVPGVERLAAELRGRGVRVVSVGSERAADCAFAAGGTLRVRGAAGEETVLVGTRELQIRGEHNVENALAAAAVALDLGCAVEDVRAGLRSFEPLAHRIEPCGQVGGVSFYDDSKATNVDATLKALTAFPGERIVLLLGGRDKGTDLSALVSAAAGACAAVVCYGEAGPRFHDAFEGSAVRAELVERGGMRAAFGRACELAEPGQVVLLSPACASFDEFSGFAERGDVFKGLVRKRESGGD